MSEQVVAEPQDTQPTDFNAATPALAVEAAEALEAVAEAPPADPAAESSSLRGARDFWLVWSGQSVSLLGDGLYGIAMAWWITQALGSATALAGYALCWFVPSITMPFLAGTLVDRSNRKALIVLMDGLQGLAVTILAVLLAANALQLWEVYVGAVILSAAGAIHGPALDSTIPNLVRPAALIRANGLYATSQSVSNIAGPLFGGTLVGLVGLPGTMLINAASFWLATIATALARIPSPRVQREAGQSAFAQFVSDATYGYRWIWAHRPILYLLLIFTSCNFLIAPTFPLQALVITRQLQGDAAALSVTGAFVLGLLSAVEGVGALVGALFFSRGYAIRPMAWGVCIGWIISALAVLIFGFSTSVVVSAVCVFGLGIALPVCNIPSQTIWMAYTPDAERGRIFAARRTIAWGIQPVSVALGGLVAERIGAGALYSTVGVVILLVAAGNLVFNQTIRRLYAPDLEPGAAGGRLIYRKP